MPPHVLIVDKDRDLQRVLRHDFEEAGFDIVSARDGATALRAVQEEPFDLILLDLALPDMPGTEVCRQLKQAPETAAIPVIIVTAKCEEVDRIVSFELGADDYVIKPFSVRELILRARAILRRTRVAAPAVERFAFGKLEVDRAAHRIWVEGEEVALTAIELRLLAMLYEHRGRVLSRDVLQGEVWGGGAERAARNVDTYIRRVRDKLGAAGDYIETVRGVGYRFRAEPPSGARSSPSESPPPNP